MIPQEAKFIINNFKKEYINSDGLISIEYPASSNTIFDNFDDIVPFFIYYGETDFLIDQIKKLDKKSIYKILAKKGQIIYSYKIDELVGGVYAVWKASKNDEVKKILDKIIMSIRQMFFDNGQLYGTYDIIKKKHGKHYYFWSSGLLETSIEMAEDYPELYQDCLQVINKWLQNDYIKKTGLYPYRYSDHSFFKPINKIGIFPNNFWPNHKPSQTGLIGELQRFAFTYMTKGEYAQMMKSNTTFVFTLIEAFRKTKNPKYKQAAKKWIESSWKRMQKRGLIFSKYQHSSGKDPDLTAAFIYIDVLMDSYAYLEQNKTYLSRAKKIIDTWISLSWRNGLVPQRPQSNTDHIDNQVDFAIAIRRYAELSKNIIYIKKSEELLRKTLKIHKLEKGYVTRVYSNSKPVIEKNNISPKYNGLLLKGIISLYEQKKIYENDDLQALFKDR